MGVVDGHWVGVDGQGLKEIETEVSKKCFPPVVQIIVCIPDIVLCIVGRTLLKRSIVNYLTAFPLVCVRFLVDCVRSKGF